MNFIRTIVVVFLVLDSCIEPFDINLTNQEAYVVDGEITDQPGPYTVKIFKPLALQDQLDVVQWVQGASVTFLDEGGSIVALLREVSPGNYQTDSSYLGVIGNTYQLHFKTEEGDEYKSTPEKLLPVGDIDSLYFQFVQNEGPISIDRVNTSNGFNILINSSLRPEQGGLVRWRWTGIFGIQTFPELKVKPSDGKTPGFLPDPPLCSGYTARPFQFFRPCTCCYCWVNQYSKNVTISDDKFINNNTISNQMITFIQANRRYLYDKYYLEVEQLSVSLDSYNFWKKVGAQQTDASSLFQTPPAPTTGNIQTVSGKIPALGVFSASAVKKRTLILTRNDVPYVVLPIDTIANSCKTAYLNSNTKRPIFW